jgi:hypothetical protein
LNINFGFKDTTNSLTSSAPLSREELSDTDSPLGVHCCLGLASRKDVAPILEVKQLRNTQAQNRRQIASAESRGGKQIGRRRARCLDERIDAFYSAQTNSVSAVSPTQRWV